MKSDQSRSGVKSAMSPLAIDEDASRWVSYLEARKASELGLSTRDARAVLARETGIPAGAIYNIKHKRTKGVRAWVCEGLKAAMIRQLQREISRLQHELQLVLQIGGGPRDADFQEIVSGIEALKRRVAEARI